MGMTNHATAKIPDPCGTGAMSLPDKICQVLGRGLCPAPPGTRLQEDFFLGGVLSSAQPEEWPRASAGSLLQVCI